MVRCGVPSAGTPVGRASRQDAATVPFTASATTTSIGAGAATARSRLAANVGATASMAAAIMIGSGGRRTSIHHGCSSGTTDATAGRAVDRVSSHSGQSSPVAWVTMPYQVSPSSPVAPWSGPSRAS